MGLEVLIIAVKPKLGREFLFWNVAIYLALMAIGPSLLASNKMVYIFFNIVGLGSIAGWTWISMREKKEVSGYIGGGVVVLTALMFLLLKAQIKVPTSNEEVGAGGGSVVQNHLAAVGGIGGALLAAVVCGIRFPVPEQSPPLLALAR
jgi:uncharacterized membrane protein